MKTPDGQLQPCREGCGAMVKPANMQRHVRAKRPKSAAEVIAERAGRVKRRHGRRFQGQTEKAIFARCRDCGKPAIVGEDRCYTCSCD